MSTAVFALIAAVPVSALGQESGDATSLTYTLNSDDGEYWMRTQDAYLAGEIFFLDDPLLYPEDIYAYDGCLYIAETGEGTIVKYDLSRRSTTVIGQDILQSPTGVFVDGEGRIYVADNGLGKVFVFDSDGNKINEYSRPDEAAFGQTTQFKPLKLTVNSSGILSIVCEGSYDGIIQLSPSGEFLGYFGYNTVPMTFTEILQDKFFTEAQKQKLFNKIPLTFYNIAQDSSGIIYTVTQSAPEGSALKKHNVSGSNILKTSAPDETNFVDISVADDGGVFAITQTGLIFEYDNDGNLLFTFGGRAISSERNGLLTVASGIAVDSGGVIYALDRERGLVHSYEPTAFAQSLHNAINLYRSGNYEESAGELQGLLMLAGNMSVIYSYLGKNEAQLSNYKLAAEYYRRAGDSSGYSDAFWEIRNENIGKWLIWIVIGIAVLAAAVFLCRRYLRRPAFLKKGKTGRGYENITYGLYMLRHPFDCCYEIKVGRKGSAVSATVIYLLAMLVFVANELLRGFSFGGNSSTPLSFTVLIFAVPAVLFVLCSFMVTEINDGKGSFRKIYIAMAYSLTPMICILPVITLLTHVLTLSEAFLVTFGTIAAYAWTGVLLVIAIREIHEYEFSQVFLNIILTLFMMIVVIFTASMLYMFWDKVVDVILSIFMEVKYRVG